GVRRPEAVAAWLAAFAKPENGIIIEVFGGGQPAAFVKVVAGRAINRVLFSRPRHVREKFGDDETVGRLFDVFAKRPPPEVVSLLEFFVRAFEQRNVGRQKTPRGGVGNAARVQFAVA